MTTFDITREFGKIWAKIIGVLAAGLGSMYGIAWLMFTNNVIVHNYITGTSDMFFMIVLPVAALIYCVAMAISISWSQAKWKLEKKERGW